MDQPIDQSQVRKTRSGSRPWYLFLLPLLPLGIPLVMWAVERWRPDEWVLAILPVGLSLFLAGLCFVLTLFRWPVFIRTTLALFLAGIGYSLALAALWALGDFARVGASEWKPYSSADGGFTVSMPGEPTRNTTPTGVTVVSVAPDSVPVRYSVYYEDFPPDAIPSPEQYFASRRDGLPLLPWGGNQVGEKSLYLNGYQGKEYTVESPSSHGLSIRRVYEVNGRIYMVTVSGSKRFLSSRNVSPFLDSFGLTTRVDGQVNPPTWEPDPELVAKLAPVQEVAGYRVQPPQGYALAKRQQGRARAFLWQGKPRSDGNTPKLWILMGPLTPEEEKQSLEQTASLLLTGTKAELANYSESSGERGKIHGLTFFRFTFQGTEKVGARNNGQAVVYHAHDGPTCIHLMAMESEPYQDASLPLLEAAARTFQKKS